jgi:hypothetical protein
MFFQIIKPFIIASIFLISGCYPSIHGKVVDSITGDPIEGAVVLVEWTRTYGLGLTYTKSYEVFEELTNNDGIINIPTVFNPLVNPPDVTIYRKGYVAWNNKYIFPDSKKRTDFRWSDGYVFKLDRFKSEYSYDAHTTFISSAIHSWAASEHKELFKNAYRWEALKSFEEIKNLAGGTCDY